MTIMIYGDEIMTELTQLSAPENIAGYLYFVVYTVLVVLVLVNIVLAIIVENYDAANSQCKGAATLAEELRTVGHHMHLEMRKVAMSDEDAIKHLEALKKNLTKTMEDEFVDEESSPRGSPPRGGRLAKFVDVGGESVSIFDLRVLLDAAIDDYHNEEPVDGEFVSRPKKQGTKRRSLKVGRSSDQLLATIKRKLGRGQLRRASLEEEPDLDSEVLSLLEARLKARHSKQVQALADVETRLAAEIKELRVFLKRQFLPILSPTTVAVPTKETKNIRRASYDGAPSPGGGARSPASSGGGARSASSGAADPGGGARSPRRSL